MANGTLFSFGPVAFEVQRLNTHEYEHMTGSDYARKGVMNSIPQREWVGENDEEIILNGMVFPRRRDIAGQDIGGFANLEQLEAFRLRGVAQTLIRGSSPGVMLGWFVIERLMRRHSSLSLDGIGRVINWQAQFARCDQPNPDTYFLNLTTVLQP